MIYLDATNHVVGRLASKVAKMLLLGETVSVLNVEKAVIIGNQKSIVEDYQAKIARGDPYHGPFYPKKPDRIFKRIVRGMIPYKTTRGSEAFKRLKAFMSIPSDHKGKEFTENTETLNKGETKSISLQVLSEKL